jgi:hypothetical protein
VTRYVTCDEALKVCTKADKYTDSSEVVRSGSVDVDEMARQV